MHHAMKMLCRSVFLLLVFHLASCGGGGDSGSSTGPTVYLAGYVIDGTDSSNRKACAWVNGTRTDLPGGTPSEASSLAVYNGNTYAAGFYTVAGNTMACYWIGDTKYDLATESGKYSRAGAIQVVAGTVYAAGTHDGKACVWINGTRTDIEVTNSNANGISIANSVMHVCGDNMDGDWKAWYWTKAVIGGSWAGEEVDSNASEARSIIVDGATVYMGGYYIDSAEEYNVPCIWSGTSESWSNDNLSLGSESFSDSESSGRAVVRYDGSTYVAGIYRIDSGQYHAALWEDDGAPELLSSGSEGYDSAGHGIAIHNGDIYVAGSSQAEVEGGSTIIRPCYWKNGSRIDVSCPNNSGFSFNSGIYPRAAAIVVQ